MTSHAANKIQHTNVLLLDKKNVVTKTRTANLEILNP